MIYIFGDSFSVEEPDDISFNGETGLCWYEIVRRKGTSHNPMDGQQIINYSSKGEGSYASMEKLYHLVENNEIKLDDKIIIMLSSQYRIPFEFLNDSIFKDDSSFKGEQNFDYLIDHWFNAKGLVGKMENMESLEWTEQVFSPEQIKYLNDHSEIILSTYLALKEEIDRANVKNIYFLKTLSQLKNIKIICFLCFEYKNKRYIDYDFNKLNDDYFKLHNEVLWNVCLQENINNIFADTFTNYRANHLSYCNHEILANIILNFFSDYPFDLDEKFHKNIIEDSQPKPFVYK